MKLITQKEETKQKFLMKNSIQSMTQTNEKKISFQKFVHLKIDYLKK